MNLYFLSQTDNDGYDTYDSCVVAARSEYEARLIHPNKSIVWMQNHEYPHNSDKPMTWQYKTSVWHPDDWANSPDRVIIELIGYAVSGIEAGVICSSYNAG